MVRARQQSPQDSVQDDGSIRNLNDLMTTSCSIEMGYEDVEDNTGPSQ